MSSVNSIATLEPICFKLYGDKTYRLYNYNENDTLSQLIEKYKSNHNLSYEEVGSLVGCSASHLWLIEHKNKDYAKSKDLIKRILNLIKKDFTSYSKQSNLFTI
ncbi:helix-turn-helix domain-containing protein [Terrisporobacter hibernicus]|uniref:HTH cro/C1-type domain-containing protein n=1 Tax=Terrisporobacter hibernicus TaxID=2813371 RepID=A0AAX2ZDC4_9FIRM|nr:hypothetical protein [Terrisporobacter hibernicus]UEL47368.1 hypothetical protein JW646_17340 [Terrisporobacter hibernicus]